MANIGQRYYRVSDPLSSAYKSNIDAEVLYNGNIVDSIAGGTGHGIVKLGIQAPSGTKVFINEKEIMIGRTGIYELEEEGIVITKLSFQRPKIYIKNEKTSATNELEGKKAMDIAIAIRDTSIDKLNRYRNGLGSTTIDSIINSLTVDGGVFATNSRLRTNFRNYNQDLKNRITNLEDTLDMLNAADGVRITDAISEIRNNLNTYFETYKNSSMPDTEYQKHYRNTIETFLTKYSNARSTYLYGVNGVYDIGQDGDLASVVIDCLYE